jgi:hypothetical protein
VQYKFHTPAEVLANFPGAGMTIIQFGGREIDAETSSGSEILACTEGESFTLGMGR